MRSIACACLAGAIAVTAAACGERSQSNPSSAALGSTTAAIGAAASVARTSSGEATFTVPLTSSPIKLDGELTEWNSGALRTGPFVDATGASARPFSEARFLHDDATLYIALYAADIDIQAHVEKHDAPVWTDDAFRVRLALASDPSREFEIDVNPRGVLADARIARGHKPDETWESQARAGVDLDGTINDPSDDDEEWVIELAVPLESLGITTARGTGLLVGVERCDAVRGAARAGERACGSFGGGARKAARLVLE